MLACGSVEPADVTGRWVVNSYSRETFLSPTQQKAFGTIILASDGTFVASEMPDSLLGRGDGFVSGSGVWKIRPISGNQAVELIFRQPISSGAWLSIGRWSTVSLFYFVGDPDSGRRIELERKGN